MAKNGLTQRHVPLASSDVARSGGVRLKRLVGFTCPTSPGLRVTLLSRYGLRSVYFAAIWTWGVWNFGSWSCVADCGPIATRPTACTDSTATCCSERQPCEKAYCCTTINISLTYLCARSHVVVSTYYRSTSRRSDFPFAPTSIVLPSKKTSFGKLFPRIYGSPRTLVRLTFCWPARPSALLPPLVRLLCVWVVLPLLLLFI